MDSANLQSQIVINTKQSDKNRKTRMHKTDVQRFRDWLDTDQRYMLKPRIIQEKYKNDCNIELLPNFIRTTKRALIKEHNNSV